MSVFDPNYSRFNSNLAESGKFPCSPSFFLFFSDIGHESVGAAALLFVFQLSEATKTRSANILKTISMFCL